MDFYKISLDSIKKAIQENPGLSDRELDKKTDEIYTNEIVRQTKQEELSSLKKYLKDNIEEEDYWILDLIETYEDIKK